MGRYLGQHFLINKNKIRKIIEALELKSGNTIIEIGPGHGELTENLKSQISNLKIIAIEKDKNLADELREKFKNDKNIEIIQGDALEEIKLLCPALGKANQKSKIIKNLKVVGNIPYYITGYLFRILGEVKNKPSLIVLTVQKEVAERICAKKGKMNLFAASIQFWAEPKIIDYISKRNFKPQPKVDSAIIKLKLKTGIRSAPPYREAPLLEDYYRFIKFIKILFKQPRKTILNNLKSQISNLKNNEEIIKILKKAGVDPNSRPQDLTIEQIIELSTLF